MRYRERPIEYVRGAPSGNAHHDRILPSGNRARENGTMPAGKKVYTILRAEYVRHEVAKRVVVRLADPTMESARDTVKRVKDALRWLDKLASDLGCKLTWEESARLPGGLFPVFVSFPIPHGEDWPELLATGRVASWYLWDDGSTGSDNANHVAPIPTKELKARRAMKRERFPTTYADCQHRRGPVVGELRPAD